MMVKTKTIKKLIIILLTAYSLFFVLGAVSAPICAYSGLYNLSGKITFMFSGSCHQKPLNSFWILGYPMALCCRCTGVYLACFVSFLLSSIKKFHLNKKVLFLLFIYTFADLGLNYLLSVNTGRISKFLSGISMGVLLVSLLNYILEDEKGEMYD